MTVEYGIYSKDGSWLKFITQAFPNGSFANLRAAKSYNTIDEANVDLQKIFVGWEKGRELLSIKPMPDRSHLATFVERYRTFFITRNVFTVGKYSAERRYGMGKPYSDPEREDVYLHDDTLEGLKKNIDAFIIERDLKFPQSVVKLSDKSQNQSQKTSLIQRFLKIFG